MNCKFYKDDMFIDNCDQSDVPHVGDELVIEYRHYTVDKVIWNYDTGDINVHVSGDI